MTDANADVNVLLIEDEPLNTTLTIAMLNLIGIQRVHAFASWRQLEGCLATLPPIHLVLLDLRLPGNYDGYYILERLRADPRFAETPIVAMTAQVMPDDVRRAEQAGFNGFLAKPLNFDRFPSSIHRLLAGERVWDA
ncbi:MAG: response regulator [Anaerolineae bacterium]|nr:response regulator [Anaerolineae bacterium]MDW8298453.1 response regulator [Anaerolineae bacterium]